MGFELNCCVCGAFRGVEFRNVTVDGKGYCYWEILCSTCYEWAHTGHYKFTWRR